MNRKRRAPTKTPSSNPTDTYSRQKMSSSTDDFSHSSILSREKMRVVMWTSLAWILILSLSLFAVILFYLSTNCQNNSLTQSAICGVGRVFNRFWSDLDSSTERGPRAAKINEKKIPSSKNSHEVSSSEKKRSIEYIDSYQSKQCSGNKKDGQCTKIDKFLTIPNQSILKSNPSHWPGEMGKAYFLPDHLKEESKRRFSENMFDIVVSDQVALNRTMPDIRNEVCKAHSTFYVQLPNTSIIIVFHNEGNSTLLRTLVSIINRTPWRLIHEIILLDDASVDREYLHEPLQQFIETLPVQVSLHRNEQRLGLISSRAKAAKLATGETLIFLDSHVEVLNGWLLYLLDEIRKNPKIIVCPTIDVLSWNTFAFEHGRTNIVGTFTWKMISYWSEIDEKLITNRALPFRTPIMSGGLYAIDRLYFEELGMYDEGMKIWGGENLEMSFKCWMCGGQILIHPCSHVAHVFRSKSPYKFLESETPSVTIFRNFRRVALVWMDEYKELIYAVNPDIRLIDGGDVSSRLELRQRLNCSSFRDYLNMFQFKNFPPTHRWIGSISTSNRRCLDSMMTHDMFEERRTQVTAQTCHQEGKNQIFMYTTTNKLQFDKFCLEPSDEGLPKTKRIIFTLCESNRTEQNWFYDQQTLQLKHEILQNQCLDVINESTVTLGW